jgi:hypothetical protein
MTCLLVVSPDKSWNQALDIELSSIEISTVGAETGNDAVVAVASKKGAFDGILIGAMPVHGESAERAALDAVDIMSAVRQSDGHIPILLWAPHPYDSLARIASRYETTAIISQDTADRIGETLTRLRESRRKYRSVPTATAPSGTVELEIGATSIRVVVAASGKGTIMEMTRAWTGRNKLTQLNQKFSTWELRRRAGTAPARYVDDWDLIFKETGEDLSDELAYSAEEIRKGIVECLNYVGTLDNIHVRFSLLTDAANPSHPFVYVPFELLYDQPKENFVRFLSPVARRICLQKESLIATPLASAQSFSGPVLFVKSDAHGVQELPGVKFGGRPQLVLPKLAALDAEFEGIRTAREEAELPHPELLSLQAGPLDALAQLREKMAAPLQDAPWQILHFAGHSVRADDGTVFLVLPGSAPGKLAMLEIGAFARWARESQLRLVVLSSCQSSSPDAVFRLAQAGIPAVIGFRWEVDDQEASYFTQCLHQELAKNIAMARAFHHAVSLTRTNYPRSPTFASPMLLAQNEEWTV